MRAMNTPWRAAGWAIALAAAALVAGDGTPAPRGGGALAVSLAWLLGAILLAGAGVAWSWALHARALARRAARAEGRLRRSLRAAHDLRDAAAMLPASPGGGLRAELARDCSRAIEAVERDEAEAAACREGLRRGLGIGLASRVYALEARSEALERELAALEARLAGVRVELTTTTSCLEEVAVALDALCVVADRPAPGRVWCDDLRARFADARKALDAARAELAAGEALASRQALRRLRGRLSDLRRVLDARQASLTWLTALPSEVEHLALEAARLTRQGHRGLPSVPVEALAGEARDAIAALQGGDPRRATTLQATLHARLDGLRRAIIGREDLRQANLRRIEAARSELALLEAAIAGLPSAAVRRRFAPLTWASAAHLEARLAVRAREAGMAIRQAAQANHLDAQAFEEAERAIGQAERSLIQAHEEVARCAASWQVPSEQEARLRAHLARLHGEVGAAYARARTQGLAPGSGLEGLLVAARTGLRQEPIDLAAVARLLAEAERVLARFHKHLDGAEQEGTTLGRWRPGRVVIVPPEAETVRGAEAAPGAPADRQ